MDELTDHEREELLGDLSALVQEMERLLSGVEEGSRPVDLDEPIGRLSRMDAIQQQKMAQASRDRYRRRLKLAQQALSADPDDYGLCRLCDDPIGYGRLKIQPEAPFCMSCQSSREGR